MNIVQLTPGAGKMFCGNCFRDNTLVVALRQLGHDATMVPLYLPLRLEEKSDASDARIFFNGINVYLEQKSAFFRHAPQWLNQLIATPSLLKATEGFAAKTRPEDVGDLTISMLLGEEGNQRRELDELIRWLKSSDKPDIVSLSNVLLVGMARKIKKELGVPVICSLQGEDYFLDALSPEFREQAWQTVAERAVDVDLFIAPSRYFGELMGRRLKIPAEKIKVIYNGINLEGFAKIQKTAVENAPPTLGYFARMCREKGLDILVDAYIELRRRNQIKNLKLKIGGSFGPGDESFVAEQKTKLTQAGFLADVEFHPNLTREQKIEFMQSLSVFSVPALYGEAFGLYVIEAIAAGVPVVQPRVAAFPELIEKTGGGILTGTDFKSLAEGIEALLVNPDGAKKIASEGRQTVLQNFNAEKMAREFAEVCFALVNRTS